MLCSCDRRRLQPGYRSAQQALAAWYLSPEAARQTGPGAHLPASAGIYEHDGVRYVVVSKAGAGICAVHRIGEGGRLISIRRWPDGVGS
jgi:hypothetical protein